VADALEGKPVDTETTLY